MICYNFEAFILTFALSNTPTHWKEKLNNIKQKYEFCHIVSFNIILEYVIKHHYTNFDQMNI